MLEAESTPRASSALSAHPVLQMSVDALDLPWGRSVGDAPTWIGGMGMRNSEREMEGQKNHRGWCIS